MRLNLFSYLCLSWLTLGACCHGSCAENDLANLIQFMPTDPFADVKSGRYQRELQDLFDSKKGDAKAAGPPPLAQLDDGIAAVPADLAARHDETKETKETEEVWNSPVATASFALPEPGDPPPPSKANATAAAGADAGSKEDWITVWCLLALILIALSPIAFYNSWNALFIVVVYLASVTLVKVFVKETIAQGFGFSETITSIHMLSVAIVVLCCERPKLSEALQVLPISALNGASLLTNNKALMYGGVAFVSMVAANVPMVTFFLELCKGKRGFTFPSLCMVSLVCCGSVCCVRGEPQASVAAFVLAAVSGCLRSARGVWQHELVSVNPTPLQLVFWNGAWSLVITLMTMLFSEGFEGFRSLPQASAGAKVALFFSVVTAVLLNITQWFAMKALGALMASIVGNLNLVLVIALSTAWLNEVVTGWQYVGVALLCAGAFGNKVQDMWSKSGQSGQSEKKPEEQPKAGPEAESQAK